MQQYACTVQHAQHYFCIHVTYIHTLYINNSAIMVKKICIHIADVNFSAPNC